MTRYNKEFKEQAMKLSDEIGIKRASEQLGIVYCTLALTGERAETGRIKQMLQRTTQLC